MGKRILLVDDSNTALLMEQLILRKAAYDVEVAHDGEEGFDLATTHKPDLILLDLIMPRMNGIATCAKLRAHEATRDVPIIMVTTRSELDHVESSYRSGCTDYVTKPINAPELLGKVRNLRRRLHQRDALLP
jgi:DNA-binding response OmpR family regulator